MIKISVKRISLTDDFQKVLEIWRACFPEDVEFAEDFLRYAAPEAEGFAVYEETVPVSMAFFLPASFRLEHGTLSAYYVYGVGTLPTHRGKGYAGILLNEAKSVLCCDLLFLYPAKPSLRSYYERLGYRAVLCRDTVTENAMFAKSVPLPEEACFCASTYAEIRSRFLENAQCAYATYTDSMQQVMLGHAKMLTFDKGVALCIAEDKAVYLPEVLCDAAEIPAVIAAVKLRYPDKTVIAYTSGEQEATGMVLPCSKAAIEYFKNRENVPFFGSFFAE